MVSQTCESGNEFQTMSTSSTKAAEPRGSVRQTAAHELIDCGLPGWPLRLGPSEKSAQAPSAAEATRQTLDSSMVPQPHCETHLAWPAGQR